MTDPAADDPLATLRHTNLSDRELLIHTLQHVESIDGRLTAFEEVLAELGPLIEKAKAHGRGARLFGGRPPSSGV